MASSQVCHQHHDVNNIKVSLTLPYLKFSASLSTVMLALPLSGYLIRGQPTNSRQSIKRALKYMRIFNCIAFISLLALFMECDSTRYYYLGGDIKYDELKVNSSWIPSGKYSVTHFCHSVRHEPLLTSEFSRRASIQ